MKNEDIKFQISQLRLDKIIYGVEAVAINLFCILLFFMFGNYSEQFPIISFIPLIGIFYTLYALIGNLFRLIKLKKLEKLI